MSPCCFEPETAPGESMSRFIVSFILIFIEERYIKSHTQYTSHVISQSLKNNVPSSGLDRPGASHTKKWHHHVTITFSDPCWWQKYPHSTFSRLGVEQLFKVILKTEKNETQSSLWHATFKHIYLKDELLVFTAISNSKTHEKTSVDIYIYIHTH